MSGARKMSAYAMRLRRTPMTPSRPVPSKAKLDGSEVTATGVRFVMTTEPFPLFSPAIMMKSALLNVLLLNEPLPPPPLRFRHRRRCNRRLHRRCRIHLRHRRRTRRTR